MEMNRVQTTTDVEYRLYATLGDFIEGWDLDIAITPDTRLVEDLEFDSIDVIQLVVAIESAFNSRSIGFQDLLMRDGRYVDDLSVGEITKFLESRVPQA